MGISPYFPPMAGALAFFVFGALFFWILPFLLGLLSMFWTVCVGLVIFGAVCFLFPAVFAVPLGLIGIALVLFPILFLVAVFRD